MGYQPVTPFRRVVDAALVTRSIGSAKPLPAKGVNKWEALRELSVARLEFGLSDRDLVVLQALVSFHPGVLLEGEALVVHPSNEALCERLNGMPLSTMRRRLARLVHSGVIARRDSPNGKRYSRTSRAGRVVFGLDLSPLACQFAAICAAAERVRAARDHLQRLRETVSLMRRDLAGLAGYGAESRPDLPLWQDGLTLAAQASRLLRRQLDEDDLALLEARLLTALTAARAVLEPVETEEMSTNPAEIERHYQNTNPDLNVLELCREEAKAPDTAGVPPPRMPLPLVLDACPEIACYAGGPIRHWHDLVRAAEISRPMMGISPSAWDEAKRVLGPEEASVVLAAILQRFGDIRSAGGYLRALSQRASNGAFSTGPMIMALLRREAA